MREDEQVVGEGFEKGRVCRKCDWEVEVGNAGKR